MPSSYPTETTGVGTATEIKVDSTSVTLSLGGTATHQIVASVVDTAGTANPGTSFTFSAVADASAGATAYTGTITGGAANAFRGFEFVVAGFGTAKNNGAFICTASSATVLTLANANGVSETHAGTATTEGAASLSFTTLNASFATVSVSGLITGVAEGVATIEVAYPAFNNGRTDITHVGNPMNGMPPEMIFKKINVSVTL